MEMRLKGRARARLRRAMNTSLRSMDSRGRFANVFRIWGGERWE